MEVIHDNCQNCAERLYSAVQHCPYCGSVVHQAEASDAAQQTKQSPGASTVQVSDTAIGTDVPSAFGKASGESSAAPTQEPAVPVAPGPALPANQPADQTPRVDQEPVPEESTKKEGKRGSMGAMGFALLVVALLGGAAYFFSGKLAHKPDTCQDELSQAASLLASGNAAGARSQTVLAMLSCSGEARSKAADLQAAADKMLAKQVACERSLRQIGSLVMDRRLERARSQLYAQETVCIESAQGKELRQKIDAGRAEATDAASQVRKYLADGDVRSAREQLNRLDASNREYGELASLRQEVQSAAMNQETRPPVADAATKPQRDAAPAQKLAPAPQSAQPVPTTPAAQPAANAQTEMARVLLRDAENALRQLRFDAAKTFVESARRLDPQNPQAAALARLIKERELQYLSEETSIK